jgi:hypothetical protein
MSNQKLVITEIKLDKNLIKNFREHNLEDHYLKLLYFMCHEAIKIFEPWNIEPNCLKLCCYPDLYDEETLIRIKNSIPSNHQKEYSAVALIISYLLKIFPEISEIECLQAKGEGFDFIYKNKTNWCFLEISGVCTNDRNTFPKRISKKRIKFKKKRFYPSNKRS